MNCQISQELKTVAKATQIGSIILSILIGIALLVISITSDNIIWFFLGLVIVVAGFFYSWAMHCLIYGFGELIEQATIIAANTAPASSNESHIAPEAPKDTNIRYVAPVEKQERCDVCGKQSPKITRYVINDESGTRSRKLCEECNATSKVSDTD